MCPSQGICRAESVRTHAACRNCTTSHTSLESFLKKKGTDNELYIKIKQNCTPCLDLLTRLVDNRQGDQTSPPFADIVLDIYFQFGKGNIASRYLAPETVPAPRPGDQAHARMILEELGLTCYVFNPSSEKCLYLEDMIYCQRHTPIMSLHALDELMRAVTRRRKRKHTDIRPYVKRIKQQIKQHEQASCRDKDGNVDKDRPLRIRYNSWVRKLGTNAL